VETTLSEPDGGRIRGFLTVWKLGWIAVSPVSRPSCRACAESEAPDVGVEDTDAPQTPGAERAVRLTGQPRTADTALPLAIASTRVPGVPGESRGLRLITDVPRARCIEAEVGCRHLRVADPTALNPDRSTRDGGLDVGWIGCETGQQDVVRRRCDLTWTRGVHPYLVDTRAEMLDAQLGVTDG